MHNIGIAIVAAVAAVGTFTALSFVFTDAKRSRTGFIIFGCIVATILFLMIAIDNEPKTDHISPHGLFTDRN